MDTKEPAIDAGNGLDDPPANADGPADARPADLAPALEAVTAERDRLAEEKADLADRLLRKQAEFQNFRNRAERERAEFLEYASSDAVKAILPILDDFGRALKADTTDKPFARGMELIYQRLADALRKLGLEPISAKGQKFDPHLHHAVDMVETDAVEDHTILDEYQPGYNFRGRLLRPAMVKVAVTKR